MRPLEPLGEGNAEFLCTVLHPSLTSDEREAFVGAVIGTKGLRLDEIGLEKFEGNK